MSTLNLIFARLPNGNYGLVERAFIREMGRAYPNPSEYFTRVRDCPKCGQPAGFACKVEKMCAERVP